MRMLMAANKVNPQLTASPLLKASPPSTGQRRLEDPPTCNDIKFYPYLSLASYTILSGFFCLIFSPLVL